MKVSYNWLQSYFETPLPSPEEIAEKLTFHSFEIEEVEKVGDDTVIDIDILPNRSSDCLSHRGIACEIATIFNLKLKNDPLKGELAALPTLQEFRIDVQNPDLVSRFSIALVSNISVGKSPEWLCKRLEAIGQKPINNIVDATNYVMFDLGQPLHVFDRGKLMAQDGTYTIAVRTGYEGEIITALTGDEYEVGPRNLLIVDGNADAPLSIAGIKGGRKAEIDGMTNAVVIEAANFNYANVRKTSQQLKLSTDASVRFQNAPSPELTMYALREAAKLIGGTVEGYADYYPKPWKQAPVSVTVSEINQMLGTHIASDETESILNRLDFNFQRDGESFTVIPPPERTDVNIKQDLIEEIGRVYGYNNIKAAALSAPQEKPSVNKRLFYGQKARRILAAQGFSEVYTYALRPQGEVKLANALAADKPYLRCTLLDGLRESLELNFRNQDLLGTVDTRIFEIGTVFTKKGEYTALGLGAMTPVKQKPDASKILEEAVQELASIFGELDSSAADDIVEFNFDELIEKLPNPDTYEPFEKTEETVTFHPVSRYPFVLRDIAVWVSEKVTAEELLQTIQGSAGELLVTARLFDEYKKEGKVSYAFRLTFLSHEKTLSDEEVNQVMETVQKALEKEGWEVR